MCLRTKYDAADSFAVGIANFWFSTFQFKFLLVFPQGKKLSRGVIHVDTRHSEALMIINEQKKKKITIISHNILFFIKNNIIIFLLTPSESLT
jgi:hypothetical protein